MITAMHKLPAGVERLPSGRYRVRPSTPTGRKSFTFDTVPEALAKLWEVNALDSHDKPEMITVGELLGLYLAEAEHAATTRGSIRAGLKAIPAEFMERPADTVTTAMAAALWRSLRDQWSPHTLRRANDALSKAFSQGVVLGMVPSNPFGVREARPKVPQSARVVAPTVATVTAVLELLDGQLRAWARTMAVCGARPGEVCGLTVDALDVDRCRIDIGPSIDRYGNITDGKNGRAGWRTVTIDLPTMRALSTLQADGPLFRTPSGSVLRPADASKKIMAAVRAAGIPLQRVYDLRHFAASQAFAGGADPVEVGEMLGDNPATVLKVYAHLVERSRSAALLAAEALG